MLAYSSTNITFVFAHNVTDIEYVEHDAIQSHHSIRPIRVATACAYFQTNWARSCEKAELGSCQPHLSEFNVKLGEMVAQAFSERTRSAFDAELVQNFSNTIAQIALTWTRTAAVTGRSCGCCETQLQLMMQSLLVLGKWRQWHLQLTGGGTNLMCRLWMWHRPRTAGRCRCCGCCRASS